MNKADYYTQFGLHLPFRFYDSRDKISEKSDFGKRLAIPKSEYLIMPYSLLLPFQIVRPFSVSTTYTLEIYCVDDDSLVEDLSSTMEGKFKTKTIDNLDYITFVGYDKLTIEAGGYYAKFSDGTYDYYSENFVIVESNGFGDIYRSYGSGLRVVDNATLRIV